MRRARQPLSQADDVFELGLLRGDGEGYRALNHIGIERGTKIGALDILKRVGYALDVTRVCDHDLGPLRFQPCAAAILSTHHGTNAIAGFQ